ncbi:MAG: hypothetical protein IJY31_02230 [Muribaculaceae bacterium]|nr:hypothetical protein [Muribaculaceae bacterium]
MQGKCSPYKGASKQGQCSPSKGELSPPATEGVSNKRQQYMGVEHPDKCSPYKGELSLPATEGVSTAAAECLSRNAMSPHSTDNGVSP